MNEKIRYILISPVRNEAKHIKRTIESVLRQNIKPKKWIIVDDGSTDDTLKIVEEYASNNPIIELIKIKDRGHYDLYYGGEIKAFYRGYEEIEIEEIDYIGKIDGDISFKNDYFEKIFGEFNRNKKLGIAGGRCIYRINNETVVEQSSKEHVRGASKIYRIECWKDINGVEKELAWDTIDVYKARMKGWETKTFDDIQFEHFVKTGSKSGVLNGFKRRGRVAYLSGMLPLYFVLRLKKEITTKPYLYGALICLISYIKCYFVKEKRLVDNKLRKFVRSEQKRKIVEYINSYKR